MGRQYTHQNLTTYHTPSAPTSHICHYKCIENDDKHSNFCVPRWRHPPIATSTPLHRICIVFHPIDMFKHLRSHKTNLQMLTVPTYNHHQPKGVKSDSSKLPGDVRPMAIAIPVSTLSSGHSQNIRTRAPHGVWVTCYSVIKFLNIPIELCICYQ